MKFKKKTPFYFGLFLLAYSCFLLIQGCSENVPMPTKSAVTQAPEPELQPLRRLPSSRMKRIKDSEERIKPSDSYYTAYASVVVDGEWHSAYAWLNPVKNTIIELYENSIKVPRGAVDEHIQMGLHVNVDLVMCEYTPHGIEFNVPIELTMSYGDAEVEGIDEDMISIFWWNPGTESWEEIESTVDKVNKTVTGKVWHFSRYSLISRYALMSRYSFR